MGLVGLVFPGRDRSLRVASTRYRGSDEDSKINCEKRRAKSEKHPIRKRKKFNMKNWKDTTTIEISTPDGRTTGPIPAKQFSERVKEGLKKMAKGKPKTIDRGQDARKVTPEYWRDPQLEEIAADLIKKHHNHLFDAEISYRVTSKPMSRAGKAIAGKARKASGLLKHFADADFIVIVSDIFWNKMDPPARRPVVHH